MKIYEFDIYLGRGYAYAAGDQDLPYADKYMTGEKYIRRTQYWKKWPGERGIYLDPDKGTKYPDFLMSGGSFFISQRVVQSLHNANITCFDAYPMPMASWRPKKLKDVEPPQYHVLVPEPGIRMESPPFAVFGDTWNGKPLFGVYNQGQPTITLCTPEIIDLAKKDKWTNFDYNEVIVK